MPILDHDAQLSNDSELTEDERTLKQRCEADIDEFRRSFVKAGNALITIRDNRLYRADYGTFDEYCSEHWGLKRSHVYRLMDSAKVIQILSPTGDILPSNERQVRPLTLLKQPEQIQQAWQKALEATSGNPTAEAVERAVKELKHFKPQKPRKPQAVEQQDGEGSSPPEQAETEIYNHNTEESKVPECTNSAEKETSSCKWILDALQRRIMQILLYDQALGMKIERFAKEHGRLPQTIIAWAVDALEVLPSREEEITELSVKVLECRKQALAQESRLAELEQALAQKDDKLIELQQTVAGFEINKADLEQKLRESEHYAAVASTKVAELERELGLALQTIASLKEQQSEKSTANTSNNSMPSATAPVPSSNPVASLKSLIDFFDRAAEHCEKPTVQIVLNGNTIVVSRNSNSYVGKHPGVLNLNTWDGLWHGRINRDGTLFKSREWEQWVLPILEEFASNPGAIASQQGKTTGSCCFCNRVLTDARSLQTGYGETCAKHYGLQWPLDAQKKEDSSPTIEQLKLETSQLEYQNDEPNATTKVGKMVEIISDRHGEEYLGIKGVIVFEDSQGYAVDVAGKELFYGADEVLLVESQERNQEIPF